jgi:hypothetical protein
MFLLLKMADGDTPAMGKVWHRCCNVYSNLADGPCPADLKEEVRRLFFARWGRKKEGARDGSVPMQPGAARAGHA